MDAVDFRIVDELIRDGRISYADLGARIGLSAHAAADRVRRLHRTGVIAKFTIVLSAEHPGRQLDAMVDVRLRPEARHETFEALAAELPAVREVAFVTGRADYQVRVSCRDADELDAVVRTLRERGGVAATETRIVMRSKTSATVPPSSQTGNRH